MKVRLLTSRAGQGWSQAAGDEIEVSSQEGTRLIEMHRAVPMREKREKATRAPPEARNTGER